MLDTIAQMRHEATGYVDPFTRQVVEKHLAELRTYVVDLADEMDVSSMTASPEIGTLTIRIREEDLRVSMVDPISVAIHQQEAEVRRQARQAMRDRGIPEDQIPTTAGEYRQEALARGDDPAEIERIITERLAYLGPLVRDLDNTQKENT